MAVGVIIVGFLASSLNHTPVEWIKMSLLKTLSATPAVVEAASFEDRETRSPSWQLVKNRRGGSSGRRGRPTKAQLIDQCNKRPQCKSKLKAAMKRGSNKPRPAARGKRPKELMFRTQPQISTPMARLQKPKSDPQWPTEASGLLSWLNPFQVAPVYADSGVSIHLTPGSGSARSTMELWGATVRNGNHFSLNSGYKFVSPLPKVVAENRPFAFLHFWVPATDTYLVNVRASSGSAKLRHFSLGQPETFHFPKNHTIMRDYLTAEYLGKGEHYFYFWADANHHITIESATLESYP